MKKKNEEIQRKDEEIDDIKRKIEEEKNEK